MVAQTQLDTSRISITSTMIVLPLTAFNYYNRWLDNSVEFWFQTNSLNGTIQAGTLNQDMGTAHLNLSAGIWRITACAWADTANGGIIDFNFNSETNSIDTFTAIILAPLTWETTITTDGTYGFQIINNGKNAGSSGYNMYFGEGIITLARVSDLP